MSDYLQPHGLQLDRLPCLSLSPGVYSNSCLFSQWWHPTISSSVALFCPQSFPTSGPFPMSQLFESGSQTIGASVSASVLPVNIQGRFPLGLTGFISMQSKGLSRVFSSTTIQKHQLFGTQPTLTAIHDYWKNHSFHYTDLSARDREMNITWCLSLKGSA